MHGGKNAVSTSLNGLAEAEGELERARAQLLKEKQEELDRVESRHDDLIREKFHLERFVTLVAYNPDEAKADNSDVWQQWKQNSQHDLLASSTGRTTRRAHQARVANLKGTSSFTSTPSPSKPTASSAFWDIVSPVKGKKLKGKAKVVPNQEQPIAHTSSSSRTSASAPPRRTGRMRVEVAIPPANFGASTRARRERDSTPTEELREPPRKRRKTDGAPPSSTPRVHRASAAAAATPATPSSSTVSAPLPRKRRAVAPPSPSTSTPMGPKRVKLIVRPLEPMYSNPAQVPSPRKFDGSLSAYLASYTRLEDRGKDLDEGTLQRAARRDAAVLEKVVEMRKKGRMLLSAYEAEEIAANANSSTTAPATDPHAEDDAELDKHLERVPGIWDHVLEDVRLHAERRDGLLGVQITGAIAGKVRGYWEAHAVKEGKARMVEERRLRALAKATGKTVLKQWERAVWYVREQGRLAREAEETRRGREHLDEILDQSGQILQSQHLDLTRAGRSRSKSTDAASASVSFIETEEDSDDEDEGTVVYEQDEDAAERLSDADVPEGPAAALSTIEGDGEEHHDEQTNALLGASGSLSPSGSSADDRIVSPSSDLVATPGADDIPEREPGLVSSPPPFGERKDAHPTGLDHPPTSQLLHSFFSERQKEKTESSFLSHRETQVLEDDYVQSPIGIFPEEPLDRGRGGHTPLSTNGIVGTPVLEEIVTAAIGAPIIDSTDPTEDGLEEGAADLESEADEDGNELDPCIPRYLKPYAVAPVNWHPDAKISQPSLLRGALRPYQQYGLEWLASQHTRNVNCILADEMGLGKTIQTIALLAHLACDRGIWGPHLIIVPTSVLLNWEMEFKKFLPGFRVLAYHGPQKRRRELRQGWYNKHHFNVCITSYTLASRDAHVFKRKPWYYMILDEAHMIKNFRSQRWNILLMFRSFRRLLLTGTPLQNNLTELWALLQFLMSGTNFANLKEFGEWFANPLEKAIEQGGQLDAEALQRVTKLHSVLRPYLLRRLKNQVEKDLPSKYEHLVLCPLSKRQRFLYDEFMSRAQTRTDLTSGVYQKIANILMQLRKVCNHPDLFEERPIATSFAMNRSAIADFEIKELLVRRRLLQEDDAERVNLDLFGLDFSKRLNTSLVDAQAVRLLDGTDFLPYVTEMPAEPPPRNVRTIAGFKKFRDYQLLAAKAARWEHIGYLNRLRCSAAPVLSSELITFARRASKPILPFSALDRRRGHLTTVYAIPRAVMSYAERAEALAPVLERFAFATPAAVALDVPRHALAGAPAPLVEGLVSDLTFDAPLHPAAVRLQLAFPDPSLLQFDCGKLQRLAALLRERKAGGHRVLIFTQMTRILDILERFLNFHGHLYLRLDGGTKIEDRQYITERFNSDPKVFCFIASSRSGGVGINLTGADTVVFYDSDFNPQMDRQCEDRAHRIGQIRDVHVYRFISQHTVEEAMLRKADQKRSLDDLVIQKGGFDWRALFGDGSGDGFARALEEFVDVEDAAAAQIAEREAGEIEGADREEFGGEEGAKTPVLQGDSRIQAADEEGGVEGGMAGSAEEKGVDEDGEEEEAGGTTVEYMLGFIEYDHEHFSGWQIKPP